MCFVAPTLKDVNNVRINNNSVFLIALTFLGVSRLIPLGYGGNFIVPDDNGISCYPISSRISYEFNFATLSVAINSIIMHNLNKAGI